MKKNYYSRKLRQLKNAAFQLNSLLQNPDGNQGEAIRLAHKVKNLIITLKKVFSAAVLKRTLAGAAFVSGIFFGNQANAQSFSAPLQNPFNIESLYGASSCAVNDFDADGDNDLMLITQDTVNNHRQFTYIQNTGTATLPNFPNHIDSPFSLDTISQALDPGGVLGSPVAVDIDGDGDFDLMTGTGYSYYTTAKLIFSENTGTAANPNFGPLQTDPFNITFTDPYQMFTAPAFVDIDNDGDQDLFVGNYTDSLLFFQNTGTATNPNFAAAVSNPFGIVPGANNMISMPSFSDLDGDGDKDLIMGTYNSSSSTFQFDYFENTGTAVSANFIAAVVEPFGLNQGTSIDFPSNFADMDGDGDKDLFTFMYYGVIEYYTNTSGIGAGVEKSIPTFEASVYPSPASDMIHLDLKGNVSNFNKIEVIDIAGKVCLSFNSLLSEINIKNLESGFYTIKFSDKSGKSVQKRIQKI